MKRLPIFLLFVASAVADPSGIDQSLEFVTPPTGSQFIRWYGKLGRTYFVQVSDPFDPLGRDLEGLKTSARPLDQGRCPWLSWIGPLALR